MTTRKENSGWGNDLDASPEQIMIPLHSTDLAAENLLRHADWWPVL